MLKKVLLALLFVVLLLVTVILVRTFTFSYEPMAVEPAKPVAVPESAIEHLQKAIQFPTISFKKGVVSDTSAFIGLADYLQRTYPLVDSLLDRKTFNYSLLYEWKGSDPDLNPVVLMAHMDVVPVDESTLDEWEAPPFSGEVKNGNIYGRGTMDDKGNVIALLEACEMMLTQGITPRRTVYLSFGHDEEVGGENGAKVIADYLESEGIKPEFVMDEGGFIAEGMIPDFPKPLAVINTGEKGYVSYKISIQTPGGHSSNPPKNNTIGDLARAIDKLEANQFEYHMIPVIEKQISIIGPEFGFVQKMAFANTWLFGNKILEGLVAHTTTAPTMLEGGVKDNVIPTQASVVVNFRIMPGETVEDVKNHVLNIIDDERFTIESYSNENNPSKVADYNTESFQLVEKTIRQLHPDIVVTPGLLQAGTDSKHFLKISDNVYRFFPTRINPDNATGFHGNNEHISIENYKETIQFVYQLMRNL